MSSRLDNPRFRRLLLAAPLVLFIPVVALIALGVVPADAGVLAVRAITFGGLAIYFVVRPHIPRQPRRTRK